MSGRAALEQRFHQLLSANGGAISRLAASYTNNPSDRDDLFQEIVGRLWAAFDNYDRQRRFSTWMYRVALNVAIDFRRRQARRDPS